MVKKKEVVKRQSRPRKKAALGVVKGTVVWISEEGQYREVLDDSGPTVKLGKVCRPKGRGTQFEYGRSPSGDG